MQPYQQRVIDEKADLDAKIRKLDDFINAGVPPIFVKLPQAEQNRLSKQLRIMGEYTDVLSERIAAF